MSSSTNNSLSLDKEILDWLEGIHTLHSSVEITFTVSPAYTLSLLNDGNTIITLTGHSLREVLTYGMDYYFDTQNREFIYHPHILFQGLVSNKVTDLNIPSIWWQSLSTKQRKFLTDFYNKGKLKVMEPTNVELFQYWYSMAQVTDLHKLPGWPETSVDDMRSI